jgi:hypothetical protein
MDAFDRLLPQLLAAFDAYRRRLDRPGRRAVGGGDDLDLPVAEFHVGPAMLLTGPFVLPRGWLSIWGRGSLSTATKRRDSRDFSPRASPAQGRKGPQLVPDRLSRRTFQVTDGHADRAGWHDDRQPAVLATYSVPACPSGPFVEFAALGLGGKIEKNGNSCPLGSAFLDERVGPAIRGVNRH